VPVVRVKQSATVARSWGVCAGTRGDSGLFWKTMPIAALVDEQLDRTLDELLARCMSDGVRAAAARSGGFSIAMTSRSKKAE
jgi:hypothetical protein